MIETQHPKLSVRRQCELVGVNRNRFAPRKTRATQEDCEIMKILDQLYTKWSFLGARKLKFELIALGWKIGRKRVRRLMRLMGIEALVPNPSLSIPDKSHKVYPYLLRNAMRSTGRKPGIFNTDQGSQFTGLDWTGELERNGIGISMDGKGRWMDNVFIERLWRSIKYERIRLYSYDTVGELKAHVAKWMDFYNHQRNPNTSTTKTHDHATQRPKHNPKRPDSHMGLRAPHPRKLTSA